MTERREFSNLKAVVILLALSSSNYRSSTASFKNKSRAAEKQIKVDFFENHWPIKLQSKKICAIISFLTRHFHCRHYCSIQESKLDLHKTVPFIYGRLQSNQNAFAKKEKKNVSERRKKLFCPSIINKGLTNEENHKCSIERSCRSSGPGNKRLHYLPHE